MATITKAANAHTIVTTGYTNPSNAYTDNASAATAAPAGKNTEISAYFGFPAFSTAEIPSGSAINSVEVGLRFLVDTTSSIATQALQVAVNTTLQGSEQSNNSEPLTATNLTHNVTTVTESNLRTADVVRGYLRSIRGNSNNAVTFSVEYVWVTVDYTPPATTINGSLGTADANGLTASVNQFITATLATASASGLDATLVFGGLTIDASLATASATGLDAALKSIIPASLGNALADGFTATLNRTVGISLGTANANGLQAIVNNTVVGNLATATADGLLAQVGIFTSVAASLATADATGSLAEVNLLSTEKLPILEEIAKSAPDSIIDLFIADLTDIYPAVEKVYFFAGSNYNYTNIVWQGITYTAYPIEAEGFEYSGEGKLPTPKVRAANINGFMTALNMQFGDLLGTKIIRKRTFHKFLDAVNFPGGTNPLADPSAEFPEEVYFIDRKADENNVYVEYELVSALDIAGVQIPKRLIIQNLCLWKYRGAECAYAGTNYYDTYGNPVGSLSLDVCGHRLSDCELRFGSTNVLNFGGFPGAGLTL